MASSFTPQLRLENPTPGDPAVRNIWGTILNTGRTLLDTAIVGVLSLNVAGSANVVLTQVDGAADQSRNAHYILSGALTGNIVVLWPQFQRMFSVLNNTSGAFTLACGVNNGAGVALGATVTIPQGGTMLLTSDGTDVKSRITSLVTPIGIGMAPVNALDIGQSTNGGTVGSVLNASTGSLAKSIWRATNGVGKGELIHHGTNFTTTGIYRLDGTALIGDGAGGLTLGTSVNQPVYVAVNNTQVAQYSTTGQAIAVNTNASIGQSVTNANAGTAASADFVASNGTSQLTVQHFGTGFTTAGLSMANRSVFTTSGINGMAFQTGGAAIPIIFGPNGTEAVRIISAGLGIGMTPVEVLDITKNQNQPSQIKVLNNDAGTAARSQVCLHNGTSLTQIIQLGQNYTPAGMNRAAGGLIESSGGGGLTLNTGINQPIYFGVNSIEIARLTSTGLAVGGTGSEILDITKDQNAPTRAAITNADAGTGAFCDYRLIVPGVVGGLRMFGTGFNDGNATNVASTVQLYSSSSVYIKSTLAAGAIVFISNDTTEILRLTPTVMTSTNTTQRIYTPSTSTIGAGNNLTVNGTYHRFTANGSPTGVVGGVDGRVIILGCNSGVSATIRHENAGSTAANRFDLPGGVDISIDQDANAMFIYNGSTSRWNLVGFSG